MTETETADRGAEAYRQAYGYIAASGLHHTGRKKRKAAWRYLLLTASPPLTDAEEASARAAMRQMRRTGP